MLKSTIFSEQTLFCKKSVSAGSFIISFIFAIHISKVAHWFKTKKGFRWMTSHEISLQLYPKWKWMYFVRLKKDHSNIDKPIDSVGNDGKKIATISFGISRDLKWFFRQMNCSFFVRNSIRKHNIEQLFKLLFKSTD